MPSPTSFSVLVLRVWREREARPLRARLTWFGDDGSPHSAPVEGSPEEMADAVRALIERQFGPQP